MTALRPRSFRWLTAMGLVAAWSGCGADDSGADADHGDMRVEWPEQEMPQRVKARAALMGSSFERLADSFNHVYGLPRDLFVRHESCGEVNAFYSPGTSSIRMCYELLESVSAVFEAATDLGTQDPAALAAGSWIFIFFHELGHAVIDLYDLPVLGMEEDAADEFAALMLIEIDEVDLALGGAVYWAESDSGVYKSCSTRTATRSTRNVSRPSCA